MVKHFLVQTLAFVHEVCRHRPAEDFRTVLQYLNSSTTGEVGARGRGEGICIHYLGKCKLGKLLWKSGWRFLKIFKNRNSLMIELYILYI